MGDRSTKGGVTTSSLDLLALVDVLPLAVIVRKPDGTITHWNRKAEALYGWSREEVMGRDLTELLVPVSGRVRAAEIISEVEAGSPWSGDFTVVRRDGTPVRVWVSNAPVTDESGAVVAIVGVSQDVTEQRLLEHRAADLTEHLRLAMEAGQLGTFRWDLASGVTEWDEELEVLYGLEPGGFGRTFEAWAELVHPDDRPQVLEILEDAMATKSRYTVEHRVTWPDGSVRWLHGSGQITLGPDGEVTGAIGCSRDITDEVLTELERQRLTSEALAMAEQERTHRERLEFLADINEALAASTSRREVMVKVANASVPRLGDWCSVYVFTASDQVVPEVEIAHIDPAMVAYARELAEQFPYDPEGLAGIPHVIRTATPEFYPVIDDAVLAEVHAPDVAVEVVKNLRLSSSIAVPLVKRGRVLGALALVMTDSRRRYTDDDFTIAEAVAARIASALDNLRLLEEQREIAAALQASLLPSELPVIDGLEMAVRYSANGEGVEVGGDFYDAFALSDDRWAVVIGDVCGTGPAAAAVTGLARHTIASAAWHGDDHCLVLQTFNRVMRRRHTDTFCTAIYGTLEPVGDGVRVTFACAGHPLPVLVASDGRTSTVGVPGRLAGVFDEVEPTPTTVALHPGDALILYTDGVTDVAPPHGLSPSDLEHLIARAAAGAESAEALADGIQEALAAILPFEDRHDDIALFVLRVPGPCSSSAIPEG